MSGFIRVGDSLINSDRLISMKYQPSALKGGVEHFEGYTVLFDTGQLVMLTREDGDALFHFLKLTKPSDGTIAISSEGST
jgi:hypothetical protein